MPPIGFILPRAAKPATRNADECLFTFDKGHSISFTEAVRSTLIIGGTGSGKTSSLVLPMCHSLLKAGFGGLIIDVKGNMGQQVRQIARACGREADIVEFGSSSHACKTNLLEGMREHETASLFNVLATSGVAHDPNVAWHQKGARVAQDVATVLKGLSRINRKCHFSRQFQPTLKGVAAMLHNRTLAQNLWRFYLEEIRRAQKICENVTKPHYLYQVESFVREVESQSFHIFKTPDKDGTARSKENFDEQITWMLQRITWQLKNLATTHNLLERFSSLDDDAVPINFYELVYRQKKVVLVHFSPDCGPAASVLARIIKERFYMALYEKGMKLDDGQYTFMVNDEFQNTMDVSSNNRFSDMELFSVSREFRNINIVATQSVVSLYAKGDATAVESLLANCTNKILLQTRDPATLKWAEAFVGSQLPSIAKLFRGKCLVDMLDADGEVVNVLEGVQNAYSDMHSILHGDRSQMARPTYKRDTERDRNLNRSISGLPYAVEQLLAQDYSENKGRQLCMIAQLAAMREASVQGKDYGAEGQPSRESPQTKPRKKDWEERLFRRELRDVIETLPTGTEGAKVYRTMFDIWKAEKREYPKKNCK